MATPLWRPSAHLSQLMTRAATLKQIRAFFEQRQVLEVETPLMCTSAAGDPYLNPIPVCYPFCGPKVLARDHTAHAAGSQFYLQTSAEFAMKRLLAAGSGSIYQLSKVFRGDEAGRYHNPEFTMLEWYRTEMDHRALMDEVDALLSCILETPPAERLSYAQLFEHHLGLDPHQTSLESLKVCMVAQGLSLSPTLWASIDSDDCLDLLMTHCIEPHLGFEGPVMIDDYPASRAALACTRKRADGVEVAERFEVYVRGMELANGYHELRDPAIQRARFETEAALRRRLGLPTIPMDHYLLAALEHGLPATAGVALGFDRLLMLKLQATHIREVISFDVERV